MLLLLPYQFPAHEGYQKYEIMAKVASSFEWKDWFFLDDPGPGMAQRVLAKQVERLARRKEATTSLVARPPPN
jgi:hypothetical protein